MITGEELKRYVNVIPDKAIVTLDGNPDADIVGFKAETYDGRWVVNLQITEGFSITKDSVLDSMFDFLRLRR